MNVLGFDPSPTGYTARTYDGQIPTNIFDYDIWIIETPAIQKQSRFTKQTLATTIMAGRLIERAINHGIKVASVPVNKVRYAFGWSSSKGKGDPWVKAKLTEMGFDCGGKLAALSNDHGRDACLTARYIDKLDPQYWVKE